jgi:hypothetical protein
VLVRGSGVEPEGEREPDDELLLNHLDGLDRKLPSGEGDLEGNVCWAAFGDCGTSYGPRVLMLPFRGGMAFWRSGGGRVCSDHEPRR